MSIFTHTLRPASAPAIRAWRQRALAAPMAALTLLLSACGGGSDNGPIGSAATPVLVTSPSDRQAIVGQRSSFFVEGQGAGLTFAWEEQPGGSGDWRAAGGLTAGDGFVSSTLTVGPVDIGMDKTRFRGIVGNNVGSVPSGEARLDVVWGTVATLESDSLGFGPGPSGPGGSADGGTPGGGDGEGAGVGGGLGKTPRAIITLTRAADGAPLGSAPAGAGSGLVRVTAGPGAAPVTITLRGAPDATYYDEGRDAMLALPADQQLHAFALNFDRHLGVTTLTEAAYRYALNNFLQDPAAVRAGTVPLRRTATAQEIARLTTAQIQLANEAIRNEINRILPARYALDSISTLPKPVDNTSPAGSITDNIFGRMQAVVGGLSLAAARFEPSLSNPGLTMNAQLADDLTDGVVDGQSLDQRSVFGAPGSNAYGPDSLPQFLADAADAQVARFGDGSIQQPPAITGQPSAAAITEGGTATLNVTATGSLLTFQWFRDGAAIPNATRPELTTQLGGEYYAVVGNGAGTVTSTRVTVTVVPATVAPAITTQPLSTTVTSGDTATFTVQATGTDLRYQWQLVSPPNTVNDIAGAASGTYTTGTAGTYRVVISNAAGTVASQDATLTVTARVIAPQITQQPTSQTVNAGQPATLQVVASGSPLAFQWHNENGPITNASTSSYTTSTAGTYHVVVSNSSGSVTSSNVTVTVIAPPAITTQPASVTINAGQQATLVVVASGSSLTYQWQRDGAAIEGANAASYATGTAGSYTATVTNPAGSVTSSAATVTVVAAPVITVQPAPATITDGTDHTFSVTATGSDLRYQWYRDDGGEGGTVAIPGATSATYTTRTAGLYLVEVANGAGTARSTPARLTVTPNVVAPSITAHPQSATINQGQTTTLSVAASGTSLQYQWRRDGTAIANANAASYTTAAAGSYTVVVSNSADSVTSNAATVTVIVPPAITTHPASATINQGQTTVLSVTASGSSLTYQWRLNGNPITGATAAAYTTGTAGSYTVVVSNGAGSATSNAATVSVVGLPSITSHPASVTINQGQTTVLSVTASGSSLSYQWQTSGQNIGGANAASYSTGAAGTYTVVVTNPAGSVTSNPATVTMVVPPAITTHPGSVTINQGQTATLRVVANGTSLGYQWLLNGNAIGGANGASYSTAIAGTYAVVVSNTAGSQTSSAATVNVIAPPTASVQPASVTINQGQTATLQASATGTAPFTYQWSGPNGPISGATSATLTTGSAGTYTVTITNAAASSNASATVNVIALPVITTHPASASIPQGGTHTFSVLATGVNLQYQWQQIPAGAGPIDIPNATSSTYATGAAGTYRVMVRNQAGSVPSNNATLSYAITAPVITTQPLSATIGYGRTHTMSVKASGSGLSWQWFVVNANRQWAAIAGANAPDYTTGVAGTYQVEVRNSAGGDTSNAATVTLAHDCSIALPTPRISEGPTSQGRTSIPVSN
jgi:hypothetical protein